MSILNHVSAHIPDEAVQVFKKELHENSPKRSYDENIKASLTAALSYLSSPCAVEVRQLEWVDDVAEVENLGLRYHIELSEEETNVAWYALEEYTNSEISGSNWNKEQAKAAALADFERRILSCVVTNPVNVAAVREQALEEAMQAIADIPLGKNDDITSGYEDAYRAVEALSPAEPAQCQTCRGHGTKDYAGFAIDACDCISDDAAVDSFARLMKSKLAKKRREGRSGWQGMSADELTVILRQHVDKGDPVDVANLCMMLSGNGQRISPAEPAQGVRPLEEWHEDHGNAVWWTWDNDRKEWLGEPAYIGKPLDSDWPDYHTHWTPHPAFPAAPTTEAGK